MLKYIYTYIILICLFGCSNDKNSNQRDCSCPLKELATVEIDSTQKTTRSIGEINIENQISAKVKQIFDVELSTKFENNPKEVETRTILRKISNEFPGRQDEIFKLRVKNNFYCAYYTNLCRDTSLSINQVSRLSNQKLKEVERDFNSFFDDEKEEEIIEPKSIIKNKKQKVVNSFSLVGNLSSKTLIESIEEKTKFKHVADSKTNLIEINYSNKIEKIPNADNLYKYRGGNLVVLSNGRICNSLEKLKISPTFRGGNRKNQVENELLDSCKKLVDSNLELITQVIINQCFLEKS